MRAQAPYRFRLQSDEAVDLRLEFVDGERCSLHAEATGNGIFIVWADEEDA